MTTNRDEIHEIHVRNATEALQRARHAKVAIILGSGLSSFQDEVAQAAVTHYYDLQGWPEIGVQGHKARVLTGTIAGKRVHVLSGRAHYYERGDASAMAVPIETLKRCGVETLIVTNAAGSLREHMVPGSVMAITDHINLSGANPLIGDTSAERFVDMRDAYDPGLRDLMGSIVADSGEPLFEGVYAWFGGPSFETPAEVRMAGRLGADAVGMSTVPEVILARRHGLRVAGLSAITNMAAGLSDERLSHEHTQEQAKLASKSMTAFLKGLVEAVG